MKKITIKPSLILLTLALMLKVIVVFPQVGGPLPENLNENDFFTDTSSNVPANNRVNLLNEGGTPNDGVDDSQNLIDLITRLSNRGGGVITIPSGEWIFGNVFLKSNVHLIFDKDAVVKPFLYPANNKSIFKIGKQNSKSENVSIRTLRGKFTVDMRGVPNVSRITVFNVKEAENFMVANCHVIDQKTIHAVLNCSVSRRGGVFRGPKKALVKNLSQENAHSGYGVIQVRTGENMLFKNLSSRNGGVTLRIESDDVGASGAPQNVAKVSKISGYNIKSTNGHAALMLQPWGAKNGWIDVQKVEAIGSKASVRIDRAFVDLNAPSIGTFDPRSRITDIKCTYGENAHINRGCFSWVPCELRSTVLSPNPIPNMENKFHIGPTIAPIFYRASSSTNSDPRYYDINIPSLSELEANSFNFPATSKMIVRQDDSVSNQNCPILGVDSIEDIDNEFIVYPNPVVENVSFKIALTSTDDVQFIIYDINGKLISQKRIKGEQGEENIFSYSRKELNLNQAGVYILHVKKSNSSSIYKRIVVK